MDCTRHLSIAKRTFDDASHPSFYMSLTRDVFLIILLYVCRGGFLSSFVRGARDRFAMTKHVYHARVDYVTTCNRCINIILRIIPSLTALFF